MAKALSVDLRLRVVAAIVEECHAGRPLRGLGSARRARCGGINGSATARCAEQQGGDRRSGGSRLMLRSSSASVTRRPT